MEMDDGCCVDGSVNRVGTSSQRDDVNNVTASGSVKVDDASYLSMDDERFYDDVDNSQNSKWTVINRSNRKPRG
jgi:hypothetical protein